MATHFSIVTPRKLQQLSAFMALYALLTGVVSFGGWAFDIPRLTDWFNDGISIQPNTAILIALAGAASLILHSRYSKVVLTLGGIIALMGALNLLQYLMDADFGFNHQLLFGRSWGHTATLMPGRFGPPASVSFILIGISLVILCNKGSRFHRYVPGLALFVLVLMMFSLIGYLFDARKFYAVPWLSAIALQTATMLTALAVSLVLHVPQHQPMLLLCERSSAGAMARHVLPILIVMIPLLGWLRVKGYELELYDLGTSRALGVAVVMLGVLSLMWIALLALRHRELIDRESDRRKDEFLATLAHELRNPLAPISNATSILKLNLGNREVSERATKMIERQLAHLVRLVDDLLDLSRITRGKLELRRERIDLTQIIHRAVETCSSMAESAQQDIIVELPAEAIYLEGDPVRLSQVVMNLLNNACKFAGRHGRISLTVNRQEGEVKITVKDNGIGIASHLLDSIFEMFTQIDQSLERSQGGLGIGLTLTKRLVELHGGSIKVSSDGLGKGSEFTVLLPAVSDQAAPVVLPKTVTNAIAATRILIADDNIDGAQSLAEVLTLAGNETFVVHDGEQAVLAAEALRPHVVLLDIGMPKLNGFDACRCIRANSWAKNILIVAVTGWAQEEDRRKSIEAGFSGHLVKPVDLDKLLHFLASASSSERAAPT